MAALNSIHKHKLLNTLHMYITRYYQHFLLSPLYCCEASALVDVIFDMLVLWMPQVCVCTTLGLLCSCSITISRDLVYFLWSKRDSSTHHDVKIVFTNSVPCDVTCTHTAHIYIDTRRTHTHNNMYTHIYNNIVQVWSTLCCCSFLFYSFPPPFITGENSNQWLLNAYQTDFSHWLPSDTASTIKK